MSSNDDIQPDFNDPRVNSASRRFAEARPRPLAVWAVFLILFVQGMTVLISTVLGITGSEAEVLDTVGQILLVALYAVAGGVLILLGFRIFLGAVSARTPAAVLELMIVVLSFGFFAGGLVTVGLLYVVPAALALVLLFTGPMRQWLGGPRTFGSPDGGAGPAGDRDL
ncbi:MAG TPA: hypothetical protein H9871_06410 [Candidatus Nesterenkonia stercoripullorum]|uniref:Uncharacterized protein n=1 Tax=Candidatus Nesterenkonia stercoripullorum TaxID=2838701 RepID=A0A9D1USU6_9MICC|nr:hypothetical protein [Candidatus Nesterenkonia stercoripullorum]